MCYASGNYAHKYVSHDVEIDEYMPVVEQVMQSEIFFSENNKKYNIYVTIS